MTWPDPNPHPTGPTGPRVLGTLGNDAATGSAFYLGHEHRPCRECGVKDCPDWFDHDRQYRGSETYWMKVARR